jgi:purine-binding chemotaxis protein CheW
MSSTRYLCIGLRDSLYALRADAVLEVLDPPSIAEVPRTPAFVRGVCDYRGSIIPVIDGCLRFGLRSREADTDCQIVGKLIVASHGDAQVGLLVDSLHGLSSIDDSDIEEPHPMLADDENLCTGITSIDSRLVGLLNLERVATVILPEDLSSSSASVASSQSVTSKPENTRLEATIPGMRILVFRIAEEEFAIDIATVEEVSMTQVLRPAPKAPKFVIGMLECRGLALPVIDVAERLGMASGENCQEKCLIVTCYEGNLIVLAVDTVTEIITVSLEDLKPLPDLVVAGKSGCFKSAAVFRNSNRLIVVLDQDNVFSPKFLGEIKSVKGVEVEDTHQKMRTKDKPLLNLLSFRVGGAVLALKTENVLEIINLEQYTYVPEAPAYVDGIISLRGDVVPLVNVAKRTGIACDDKAAEFGKVLIVGQGGQNVGLKIDTVLEISAIDEAAVSETPGTLNDIDPQFLSGIIAARAGADPIFLLDLDAVLGNDD